MEGQHVPAEGHQVDHRQEVGDRGDAPLGDDLGAGAAGAREEVVERDPCASGRAARLLENEEAVAVEAGVTQPHEGQRLTGRDVHEPDREVCGALGCRGGQPELSRDLRRVGR